MKPTFCRVAALVAVGLSFGWGTERGLAEEPVTRLGPPGSVDFPRHSFYGGLSEPKYHEVVDAHYRPFFVLGEGESIKDVVAQLRRTRPLLTTDFRVMIPEWPKEVDLSEELRTAAALQQAVESDRLSELLGIAKAYTFRGAANPNVVPNSLDLHATPGDWPKPNTLPRPATRIRRDAYSTLQVRIVGLPAQSFAASFDGRRPRLGFCKITGGGQEVSILFYENGMPFVLHTAEQARGFIGLQVRWLPDGKVAQVLNLTDPWTGPTANPQSSFGGKPRGMSPPDSPPGLDPPLGPGYPTPSEAEER